VREIHIRIADDPRVVGGPAWFPWPPERGLSPAASEARLLEHVLHEVVRSVEERQTEAKQQRFRVIRAA
jgi:hypothetical protein